MQRAMDLCDETTVKEGSQHQEEVDEKLMSFHFAQ